jgi:hypothetical protein
MKPLIHDYQKKMEAIRLIADTLGPDALQELITDLKIKRWEQVDEIETQALRHTNTLTGIWT